ncbi:MAG TPA: hypothetical protein PKE27_17095 [Povalibacter sp.]|uniref:hypothetical protein n=1 Tax=Povalibacter sp. TaxID=1962978 RepID=UPI002CEFDD01|nr:hypothetical protein [Povalibacter sp.]HMN46297.1 hypothetical protein [Povalibacter sp.]
MSCGISLTGLTALLACTASFAIDIPKPENAPAAEPSQATVTATDETAFYERLQYVAHKRLLVGLGIGDDALKSLGAGSADAAIGQLSQRSVAGDRNATIALVRIQHWCNRISQSRPADIPAQLARFAPMVSTEKLARIAGVLNAERSYQERARQGCSQAPFDYQGIESRLRQAAEAGDPASATELAQFVRDPAKREAFLQQAVDRNYAPAQQAMAMGRLIAVQRGQTTENVSSIRLLFKQAGRTLPRAKVELANCMATGCDGHPADSGGAAPFGFDAAKDGEPLAFTSMMRMPWGNRQTRVQMLGWQYYGDRLNETGCTGDAYVQNAVVFSQSIGMLEKGQPPSILEQAKTQGETLWQQNSERAKKEQGCG